MFVVHSVLYVPCKCKEIVAKRAGTLKKILTLTFRLKMTFSETLELLNTKHAYCVQLYKFAFKISSTL